MEFKKEDKKLIRLDGNHRLSVLKEAANGGLKKDKNKRKTENNIFEANRLISFCIILTPQDNFTFEHLYFYLLNSKALPISSIKTLDIITKTEYDKIKDFIQNDDLLKIMNETKKSWLNLDDKEKAILFDTVKELLDTEKNNQDLKSIIEQSIGIYFEFKEKPENSLGIICFLRKNSNDANETREKYKNFLNWINKFKYKIEHFKKMNDLYEAFIKYDEELKNKRYIFVAMQWHDSYKKTYTSVINNAIYTLKGKYKNINFELLPIMEQASDVNIPEKIFDEIEKCDIFIVDTSTNNSNVLFEYGFAKANEKHIIALHSKQWREKIIKELGEKPSGHVKKIQDDLKIGAFDIRVNNNYQWNSEENLQKCIEKELEIYLKENNLC